MTRTIVAQTPRLLSVVALALLLGACTGPQRNSGLPALFHSGSNFDFALDDGDCASCRSY